MSPMLSILPFEYHKGAAENSSAAHKVPTDSGAGLSSPCSQELFQLDLRHGFPTSVSLFFFPFLRCPPSWNV